jgi:hypothetical protein
LTAGEFEIISETVYNKLLSTMSDKNEWLKAGIDELIDRCYLKPEIWDVISR